MKHLLTPVILHNPLHPRTQRRPDIIRSHPMLTRMTRRMTMMMIQLQGRVTRRPA
jgi:hypothetical protein